MAIPPLPSAKSSAARPLATAANQGYNQCMVLGILAMKVLEVMFFIGLAGSAVVVLISFVEDAKELFGED